MGFNVLDPKTQVLCSRLIEASAGTGKTFAIQHLLTRIILSDPPLAYDQVALVTFTNKATQSLK